MGRVRADAVWVPTGSGRVRTLLAPCRSSPGRRSATRAFDELRDGASLSQRPQAALQATATCLRLTPPQRQPIGPMPVRRLTEGGFIVRMGR